mmetsp:Transcript_4131/g.7581  ORF Transcript_4131/g.7581 Transcript_4131/m.7581 type:complete len:657 (-) Transcript_4131:68-2038(-)
MAKGSLRLLIVLALATSSHAHSFLDSNEVTENEVQQSLLDKVGTVDQDKRRSEIHQALLPTYTALPKNSQGLIDHQAVRYVLHRMFVQKYGWYIKGLEPSGDHWHHDAPDEKPELAKVKEWVPTYMQDLLETQLHHKGLDLNGLVQLAMALEELVSHEAENRLKTAYRIHALPTNAEMSREDAADVVRTWYVGFLLAGNFSADSPEEVHAKKAIFARKYSDWQDADDWLMKLEEQHYKVSPAPTYNSTLGLVKAIGETYFHFNDGECRALKSTLRDMEGKKAGRVRLSTFYKKSLYSHWRFTEKADYLRTLGALDDSDVQQPQVIIANYMMARPNCLESSGLYAICCRNECEDLMGQLETSLQTSIADPKRIAALVANMSSDTVTAPRVLSSALLQRLEEVAGANNGQVPLHGRLFAQWMHHAYPRECPYPHEFGTTSPQTPDEWMKETGQSDSSATVEEMQKQVESDVCQLDENGKPKAGCDEGEDLPWSQSEELLVKSVAEAKDSPLAPPPRKVEAKEPVSPSSKKTEEKPATPLPQKQEKSSKSGMPRDVICAAFLAIALALALILDYWRASATSRQSKGEVFYLNQISSRDLAGKLAICQKALMVWGLASIAWLMDLLDTTIFSCSMCCGLFVLVLRNVGLDFRPKRDMHKL